MYCTSKTLRTIVARATPFRERQQDNFEFLATDRNVISKRQHQWREVFSFDGDEDSLARRLAFDGMNIESCRTLLNDVKLTDDRLMPEWAERFERLMTFCHPFEQCHPLPDFASPPPLDSDKPMPWDLPEVTREEMPFPELTVPFVEGATIELRQRAGKTLEQFSDAALIRFQHYLLGRLCGLSMMTLSLEFKKFVTRNDPLSMFRGKPPDNEKAPRTLYHRFIEEMLSGGLLNFFQEYAVLARLISIAVEHWIEQVAEFCGRLERDRADIAKLINQEHDLGVVAHVKLGLSDPHNRGRSVVSLTFASGLKLIYKPKDLGIDIAFFNIVEWFNSHGGTLPLRTLRVLNRTTHGWVEYVEHEPLQDAESTQRFYRRVGMILCLVYALQGTDFHLENIVAAGEQPILIDLETMLQAVMRPWDTSLDDSADQLAVSMLEDSVLRNGLLPSWIQGGPGKSFDLSGLGGNERQDTGNLYPDWEHVNTDRMQLVYKSAQMKPEGNVPVLEGQVVSARDYCQEIAAGFTECYRVFITHRNELLADNGPLEACRGLELRQVLRATQSYAKLARRMLHPEFLRDGIDRGIEIERLARAMVLGKPALDHDIPWGMFRAEAEAMELLDIPFFNVMSDGTDLIAGKKIVARDFFEESGMDRVRSRIIALSEDDLEVQSGYIRAAMHVRWLDRSSRSAIDSTDSRIMQPIESAVLIEHARRIAEQIRSTALRGKDGSVSWFSLAVDGINERLSLMPMGDNLYDGRLGVVFFLAALDHITGVRDHRDLIEAALMTLKNLLRGSLSMANVADNMGGASGLGSQIYSLVHLARWLNDDELLVMAHRLTLLFVPRQIARDESLDVIGGVAGGIMGLLAQASTTTNGDALDAAVCCGDHLLKNRVITGSGVRAWKLPWSSRPLTGFAHGAAGIACALARLATATGESRFLEAAHEGIEYEGTLWSEEAGNWPDLRDDIEGGFMNAWCYGAAGIGLGRLDVLKALDENSVRRDIDRAVVAVQASPIDNADHVCCGNLGRLDLLIEAAKRLNRPELLLDARRRAAKIVERADHSGSYSVYAQVSGVTTSPSFFQGLAGIGYQLLRLGEPNRLPCVLVFE